MENSSHAANPHRSAFPSIGVLISCLFLCGCFHSVKDDLSGGQVVETAIISLPSREKSLGFLPKYDRFLEGYVKGGLVSVEGKPVQGATVEILNDKGERQPGFIPGITDQDGIYKVRFSLPIRWDTVDFCGVLACGAEWKLISPRTEVCLYFNRRSGTLAYSPKTLWLSVKGSESNLDKNDQDKKSSRGAAQAEEKKKSDDPFDSFDFGP